MNRFKIIFVGESNVGKSSLCARLVDNTFKENINSTIGAQFFNKFHGSNIYDIWDTAGQEKYKSLVPLYYRGAHIVILVFDLTSPINAGPLCSYIDEINSLSNDDKDFIIIGNKSDMISQNECEEKMNEIKNLLNKYNFPHKSFIIASAKTGDGIDKLMNVINDWCTFIDFDDKCYEPKIEPVTISSFFSFCNIL